MYAAVDDDAGILLLAGGPGDQRRIVALDLSPAASHGEPPDAPLRVLWTQSPACYIGGLATLPNRGVFFLAECLGQRSGGRIVALDTVTGAYVAHVPADYATFLAVDAEASVLYASCSVVGSGFSVFAWYWDGTSLQPKGPVPGLQNTDRHHPIAVTPAGPGGGQAHLVTGVGHSPDLTVLSIPDYSLVRTDALQGIRVVGLAADPSGSALIVCSEEPEGGSVHVLPWPELIAAKAGLSGGVHPDHQVPAGDPGLFD
jgi:hypothetical protein